MKIKLFLILILISINIKAQNIPSAIPIMELGMEVVSELESEHEDIIIKKIEFDLVQDENLTFIELEIGTTYTFTAFGDSRIADLSLTIFQIDFRGNMTKVAIDEEESRRAALTLTPEESGKYAVDVRVNEYTTRNNIGHYGLIIANVN